MNRGGGEERRSEGRMGEEVWDKMDQENKEEEKEFQDQSHKLPPPEVAMGMKCKRFQSLLSFAFMDSGQSSPSTSEHPPTVCRQFNYYFVAELATVSGGDLV